jgi:hypothetical protein
MTPIQAKPSTKIAKFKLSDLWRLNVVKIVKNIAKITTHAVQNLFLRQALLFKGD